MGQALNNFDHFKEGLFMYRKDGRYPIDNNLAERHVRPFTALQKAIQHYGRRRRGNGSSIFERSEYSEACRSIGMAVPRGLPRGYGDRREEASFASKPVDHIKKQKI